MNKREIHLLCLQFNYRGDKALGRWTPVGKVILRVRVDYDEWENNREIAINKLNRALVSMSELGVKYVIKKVFKLPHQTVSFQHIYDTVVDKYFKEETETE